MSYHVGSLGESPLDPILTNNLSIKLGMTGAAVDAAKALMRSAGFKMSPSIGWQAADEAEVRAFQIAMKLPVTSMFDAATYSLLKGLQAGTTTTGGGTVTGGSGSMGGATENKLPSWALPVGLGVVFFILLKKVL